MTSIVEIVSYFNTAKQQAIVWHQQTTSVSEHKGLEIFYDEITGLLDDLSESTAGIYGRLKGYEVHDLEDWTSTEITHAYFKNCFDWLAVERKNTLQDTWLQNQLDEIAKLLAITLYRLTLK